MRIIIDTTDGDLTSALESLQVIDSFDAVMLSNQTWLNSLKVEQDQGPVTVTIFSLNNDN